MAKPNTLRKSRRSAARQPAATAQLEQENPADPILFLGEEPATAKSFHVKQPGVAGARADVNNKIIADNLLDLIVVLCEDGIISPDEWAESITAIGKMLEGNGS